MRALKKEKYILAVLLTMAGYFVLCAAVMPAQADLVDLKKGRAPYQILVEVLVADISHDNDSEFGIQHEFNDSGQGSVSLFNDDSRTGSGSEYTTRYQTGDLGSVIARFPLNENSSELYQGLDIVGQILDVDSGQLFASIQALAEKGRGEILSRPSIVTIDGQEAKIETGEDVPYLTRQVTAQREIFVSSSKPTGITLTVTPRVMIDDEGQFYVQLTVKPSVSFVSRKREERGIFLPVVASREASTTVLVASGRTFILGGLFRDNETLVRSGVPGLSRIPLLGMLFSSTTRTKVKSELIISITPTVLAPAPEARQPEQLVQPPQKRHPVRDRQKRFRPGEQKIPERMQMEMLQGWGQVEKPKNGVTLDEEIEDATAEQEPESY